MAKGLDIGTGNIVGCQYKNDKLVFRSYRNVFVPVDPNPVVRNMLKKSGVPSVELEGKIYALGEHAIELASAFQSKPHRPMARGVINPQEQKALPIIKAIIGEALGQPETENEVVFYSVPADPVDAQFNAVYHAGVFEKVLTELGYKPTKINEGLTVIYSELLDDNLSGIGVSFGAGMCNVACSIYGSPVFEFSVASSGDYIDENVATSLAIPSVKAMKIKEGIKDLRKPEGQGEEAVVHYYKHMLRYVADNIVKSINALPSLPGFNEPPKVAVAGGTSLPPGFIELFGEMLQSAELPIKLGEVIRAEDPLKAIAKGALFAAIQAE